MKPKCQQAVNAALGRSIDRTEAEAIERNLRNALRQDAAADLQTFRNRAPALRVLAAAHRLAGETVQRAVKARAALDGGQRAYVDELRAEGFDADTTYYHGATEAIERFRGDRPIYLTRDAGIASLYASPEYRRAPAGNVVPVLVKPGRQLVVKEVVPAGGQAALIERARQEGYDTIDLRRVRDDVDVDGNVASQSQLIVLNPENVRPRFGVPASENGGQRYNQFGGQHSQAYDGSEFLRAEAMLAEGADDLTIWRETGWWRNPTDGLWRYEIDDSQAALRLDDPAKIAASIARGALPEAQRNVAFQGRLSGVLDFPELFEAYPALGDLEVRISLNHRRPAGGAFTTTKSRDYIRVNAGDEASALGILLHEVQHAIQGIEGFHGGGDPNAVRRDPRYRAVLDEWIVRSTKVADDELALQGLSLADVAARNPEIHAQMLDEIERSAALKVYSRIAGEMEARNVENRRGQGMPGAPGNKKLSSRARQRTPPSETFDLPIGEAIVELEEGARRVALKSIAGDALGPRPAADDRRRLRGAAGRQESRRPQPGAGDGLKGFIRRAAESYREAGGLRGDGAGDRLGQDGARGETFIPEGGVFADPGVVVSLFKSADRSTPFHEFGHVFLETMHAYAARPDAPEALLADVAAVRRWLGAKENAALTREQHEQFARGFEAYLREGRAPSPSLASAFEAFKRWLVGIYKSVRELDVELDDEIRGVFDRLVKEPGNDLERQRVERGVGSGRPAAGADAPGTAGPDRASADERTGAGADAAAPGGASGSRDGGGASATKIPPALAARDPELKDIADALIEARAEIEALELQGLVAPAEAAAARADLEAVEKQALRPELMRSAMFCLMHGARVRPGGLD